MTSQARPRVPCTAAAFGEGCCCCPDCAQRRRLNHLDEHTTDALHYALGAHIRRGPSPSMAAFSARLDARITALEDQIATIRDIREELESWGGGA